MAKHGSGGNGKGDGSFFDQMFDINRNGKVDAMDFFLLHQIYEESHKSTSSDQTTYRNYAPITPSVSSVDPSWETDDVSPINGNIHAGADDAQEESDDWQLYAYEGDEYGIYPYDYDSREEYMEAVEEAEAAVEAEIAEEELAAEQLRNGSVEELEVFEYCSVLLPEADRTYNYLTGGLPVEIGDRVVVPVGADNKEVVGVVASVGKYTRISAPFPMERTKKVLRKVER